MEAKTNEYKIILEDTFSFATTERVANMTEIQYQSSLKQMEAKQIVVDYYDKKQGIHCFLRIKSIQKIN
jgi:hypothetical protein